MKTVQQVMSQEISLPSPSRLQSQDFIFGVATSSFQIEGDRQGRLASIWDKFCQQPGAIADRSNGEQACDHVKHWLTDLEHIKALGVDAYRFSISWPRVINETGDINPEGLAFYVGLINELRAQGIKVFVTLYHWDLPQHLEDKGGWLNRETAYQFADYVDKVSNILGSSVDAYITLNEPYCSAYLGYEMGVHAPGKTGRLNGRTASHHLLLAHGLAMGVLRKNAPLSQHGIVLNIHPGYPRTSADTNACRKGSEYLFEWYLDPVVNGQYPPVYDLLSEDELPPIIAGDMELIKTPVDFIGLNYYTRNIYSDDGQGWFVEEHGNDYPKTEMGWEVCPHALTDLLVDLNRRYDLPPIYITENGAAMDDALDNGEVCDGDRIAYFQEHLLALDDAIKQGVDVRGYFAWSLMDNFEWALGYSKRFGLIYVDYQTQQRVWKQSAKAYQAMLQSKKRNAAER